MTKRFALLMMVIVWFASVDAQADGTLFPSTLGHAYAKVSIPDQRALIQFADGTESLVIETSFIGSGTNFAWVVPLPAPPKIKPVSRGVFRTLESISQPRIIHNVSHYYIGILILTALLVLVHRSPQRLVDALLLILLFVILFGMLLPAQSGGSTPLSQGVAVLERQEVGIYETATITGKDSTALMRWLAENQFHVPSDMAPAIDSYVKQGWIFVAAKVAKQTLQSGGASPHPLAFTFKTTEAVYPLQLTSIGNDSTRIELYVFGNDRAEAAHFKVERCEQPQYPAENDESGNSQLEELRIRHPGLRTLVANAPVVTKLTGTLTSTQMQSDAYITWTPYSRQRLTRFSPTGAALVSANISAILLLVGILVVWQLASNRPKDAIPTLYLRSILLAVGCGLLTYLAVPKIEVVAARTHPRFVAFTHVDFAYMLLNEWEKVNESGRQVPTLDWARASTKNLLNTAAKRKTNPYTGEPLREEDSPGNYTLNAATNGIEYVWHDIEGRPRKLLKKPIGARDQ